jgi:hypothetical protein
MLNNWEVATMSHLTTSITASVEDLTKQMTPYLGNVGAKLTEAVTKKIAVGAAKEAQVASPSRETEMVGANIAQGFISGAQEYVDDARRVGEQLGSGMVQTASGLFIPGGAAEQPPRTTGAGVPLSVITENARRNREQLLATQQQRQTAAMNARMNSLNKAFMSGTFALSALSGVASMAGGNLGKFSEILFQISGPLFALSSVIQLLTGNKIVSIISKFRVGFGLASVALIAGVGIIKLINNARQKELEYIYGLSNAMKTTTEQVKTLGDFFGVVPTKLPFENRNREIVRRDVRTARDRLREDAGFQKQFGAQIKTLSKATAQEAQLAFTSLALNLKAQGFASEQVQTLIDALREEAGKTEVKLDVKSLDFSAESIKGLQGQIKPLLENLGQQVISGGIKQVTQQNRATGELVTYTQFTNNARKALEQLGTFISETSKSSAGMFRLGVISGEQFEASIYGILETMNGLDEASRKVALIEIFKKLDVNAEPFLKNLQSAKQEMMLIALLSSGVLSKDSPILKALESKDAKTAMRGINGLRIAYENLFGAITDVNKADKEGDGTGGPNGAGKPNALQERINAIKQQTQAYIILRNAKIDEKTATELSNDAEIASLVIKNSTGKSLTQIIAKIKEYTQALKNQASAAVKFADPTTRFKNELERLQKVAVLREKLIDIQFAPKIKKENDALSVQEKKLADINAQIEKVTRSQIEPIQAVIDSNNLALEKIALQEDAINEKYNKQIESLDKIATINQNIANIQKQRLSIADALTRGDISTATQLMQDARAEQAQSAVTGQKDALSATRDAAISALGRNAIEKQNKELQLQINIIEATQLKTLQEQKQTIEDTITSINANITALNEEVRVLKEGANYAGKTKKDIDDLAELIAAAEAAGIPFTDQLLKQAENAERLAAALLASSLYMAALSGSGGNEESVVGTPFGQAEGTKKTTTKTTTKTPTKTTTKTPTKAPSKNPFSGSAPRISTPSRTIATGKQITVRGRPLARMFGGPILSKGRGGMGAVKAMAFGGRAIGSDTVPAMLTPGEFVMNKGASKAYGPLLERINESKYPSMLGLGGMTQIPVNNISTSMNDNSTAVYNYNLGFSINGSNGSAKDIANAVMREIKNVDSQRIRGQRR